VSVKPRSMVADLDSLPFATPGVEERPALAPPRKCPRHRWQQGWTSGSGFAMGFPVEGEVPAVGCINCGRVRDPAASRRGRNNRNRGNAIEREVAAKLGLRRVGQFGGPDDVRGEWLVAQVKSGGAFPERIWKWLNAITADAGQTRAVVITDAPGPGHRRRALIVLDLADWAALHGTTSEDVA
jgi:hypothetical protein